MRRARAPDARDPIGQKGDVFAIESTAFAKELLGRYTCNTLSEALASADPALHPGARPLDVIGIGGAPSAG
jgi:hypothetical protein